MFKTHLLNRNYIYIAVLFCLLLTLVLSLGSLTQTLLYVPDDNSTALSEPIQIQAINQALEKLELQTIDIVKSEPESELIGVETENASKSVEVNIDELVE